MSSAYDQRVEELLADYRAARERAVDSQRRVGEIEATATAPRQAVKITVGAQGQVKSLEFPTGAYRHMAPKELSKVILAALERAREQALSEFSEVAFGGLLGGASPADVLQGRFDPRSLLPEEIQLPETVRDYVERGLGRAGGSGHE